MRNLIITFPARKETAHTIKCGEKKLITAEIENVVVSLKLIIRKLQVIYATILPTRIITNRFIFLLAATWCIATPTRGNASVSSLSNVASSFSNSFRFNSDISNMANIPSIPLIFCKASITLDMSVRKKLDINVSRLTAP